MEDWLLEIWIEVIKGNPQVYNKLENPPQELTDLYNLLSL